jgi:hypothetical protein
MQRGLMRDLRGVAIIEFVIALPLLLVLIMATAEFGRAMLQYNTLTQALRDGARYVSSNAMSGSSGTMALDGLESAACNLVRFGNVGGSSAPLLPGTVDCVLSQQGAEDFVLSAQYAYAPIFAALPMFGYGQTLATLFTFEAAVVGRAL